VIMLIYTVFLLMPNGVTYTEVGDRITHMPIVEGQTIITDYSDLGRRCFHIDKVIPYVFNQTDYGSEVSFIAGEVYARKVECALPTVQ